MYVVFWLCTFEFWFIVDRLALSMGHLYAHGRTVFPRSSFCQGVYYSGPIFMFHFQVVVPAPCRCYPFTSAHCIDWGWPFLEGSFFLMHGTYRLKLFWLPPRKSAQNSLICSLALEYICTLSSWLSPSWLLSFLLLFWFWKSQFLDQIWKPCGLPRQELLFNICSVFFIPEAWGIPSPSVNNMWFSIIKFSYFASGGFPHPWHLIIFQSARLVLLLEIQEMQLTCDQNFGGSHNSDSPSHFFKKERVQSKSIWTIIFLGYLDKW